MSKINAIILDGVGINLKTSIMNTFKDWGYATLESDSWFYINDNLEMFPNLLKYSNRVSTRFLEMDAVIKSNQTDTPVIIDRGCVNQAIWGWLTYTEVVDNYVDDREDFKTIMENLERYKVLENTLRIKRFLLTTEWRGLLDFALDEDNYFTDSHTAFRIDTYYDSDYYQVIKRAYNQKYQEIFGDNFESLVIEDQGNDLNLIPKVVEQLALKIDSYVKTLNN